MAIEIQPEQAQQPGGGGPAAPPPARPWWLRPAIHTAILGAVIGYFIGHWLGNFVASGYLQVKQGDENNFAIVFGYVAATIGFLAGLGVFNDLLRQMAGRPPPCSRSRGIRAGQVLQVHPGPQGGRSSSTWSG